MKPLNRFINGVERVNKFSAECVAWLVLINSFAIGYDVICRYVLGRATDWGYDVGWMLYSVGFMIGGAYTLKERGHVRVDLLWNRYSQRTQSALDIAYWIVFILPLAVLLTIYGIPYAAKSWAVFERSAYSAWRPYIFPFKTIIPLTFLLLTLQIIADVIRKFTYVVRGDGNNG